MGCASITCARSQRVHGQFVLAHVCRQAKATYFANITNWYALIHLFARFQSSIAITCSRLSTICPEKSGDNDQRISISFFGDFVQPLDMLFADGTARDYFCTFLSGLNHNIIMRSSGSANPKPPQWVVCSMNHLPLCVNHEFDWGFSRFYQDDTSISQCMRCSVKFGILERKHHCRLCGEVVCANCSPHTAVLPNLGIRHTRRATCCNHAHDFHEK